jgi:hypothetical protein
MGWARVEVGLSGYGLIDGWVGLAGWWMEWRVT